MADTIFLSPGELSARTLNKAKSNIDKAVAKTKSANDSAAGAYYYFDGLPHSLFTGEIGSLVAQAYLSLNEAQAQIEALSKIINSGPDSLESIDKARKSDLTNWLDRAVYDAKSTLENVKSGFIGFITGLFSSGGASTGGETSVPAINTKPAKTPNTKDKEDFYNNLVIGKKEPVQRGKIRYYRQDPGLCNRACETMAFSYIGIDVHPNSLHDKEYIKYEFASSGVKNGYSSVLEAVDGPTNVEVLGGYYKGNFDRSALDELVSNFEKDLGAGLYSPVMLHYDKGSKDNYKTHWILIIGKNEDGTYRAIGPGGTSEEKGFNVSISDSGVVSGTGFSGCNQGRTVAHIGQYHRTD